MSGAPKIKDGRGIIKNRGGRATLESIDHSEREREWIECAF